MTAAHCIASNDKPEEWLVVAGSKYTFPRRSNTYYVENFKIHPEYVIKPSINDIAILVIEGKFKFSKNIKMMSMANSLELPKGKNTFIVMNKDFFLNVFMDVSKIYFLESFH